MTDDIAAIAEGLTAAQRARTLSLRPNQPSMGGYGEDSGVPGLIECVGITHPMLGPRYQLTPPRPRGSPPLGTGARVMLLIPEIETVVILTPRTGTRSLKQAVAKRYPQSTLIYRHMEADGVPFGYDRWRKVGVVRDPVDRLWSLYKYLTRFGLDWCQEHDETYTARMRASVAVPFEDWLQHNDLPFTTPYDSAGLGRFFPAYAVRHPLPENRKSQFIYLRPDLGTQVYHFDEVHRLFAELDVTPPHINGTDTTPTPALSADAAAYVSRWFQWDMEQERG